MIELTLIKLLQEYKHLKDTGITFIEKTDVEVFMSYCDLYEHAERGLSYLQSMKVQRGDEVVLQIDDNRTFIVIFWSCILGGIIPVPLTVGNNEDHRQKIFKVWPYLNRPHLISSSHNISQLEKYAQKCQFSDMWQAISISLLNESKLLESNELGQVADVGAYDVAFVQFSSGSTGSPKGVTLTHHNLITNVKAIGDAARYNKNDSLLSWMPLTHDMGLIGFHLNPLYYGINHYIIPTNLFIRRPALWVQKASEHQVTVTCSPNFGYRYLLKHFNLDKNEVVGLSSIRLIYNGAEPISESLCMDFMSLLNAYGLRDKAICPVYGLAEASLAVSMSNIDDDIYSLRLDRGHLDVGDKIKVSTSEQAPTFVNVGKAIKNCKIRITNDQDEVVGEEIIGHIQICGENVTTGYYNNSDATFDAFTNDQWIRTGDLGFISNDCLYVTGRAKDIVIVNGQNFYAHDLECLAESVPGIELNKIVIAGVGPITGAKGRRAWLLCFTEEIWKTLCSQQNA